MATSAQQVEALVVPILAEIRDYVKDLATAKEATRDFASNAALQVSHVVAALTGLADAVKATAQATAGAAAQGFAEYQAELAKIEGLVGESRDQVRAWGKDLLDMSVRLGKSPLELARALYFLTSAGISGKAALDALEISAKAASAGLGETMFIADAISSAMNAYAGSGLTAAKATDVLVAAVKLGKVEADQFARVIGRVIPLASTVGVAFEEVAGAMAAMSLLGASAAEASVAVQNILLQLQKPSREAVALLESVGLSFADLRKIVQGPGGIIKVLRILQLAFKDNDAALTILLGNSRAIRGGLNLLSQDGAKVDAVLRGVRDAAGDTNAAFEVAGRTLAFAWNSARAAVEAAAIEIGAELAPALSIVAEAVAATVQSLRALPPRAKVAVAALTAYALVAALAALSTLSLVIAIGALAATVGWPLILLGALAAAVTAVAIGLTAAVVWVYRALGVFEWLGRKLQEVWQFLLPVRKALDHLGDAIARVATAAFVTLQGAVAYTLAEIEAFIGGAADWQTWSTAAVLAVTAVEAFLGNLPRAFAMIEAATALTMEFVTEEFRRVFQVVIPGVFNWFAGVIGVAFHNATALPRARFVWLADNVGSVMATLARHVKDVFTTAFEDVATLLTNLVGNFKRVKGAIPELLRGRMNWSQVWKPLTEGTKDVIKDLDLSGAWKEFEPPAKKQFADLILPDREFTDMEKELIGKLKAMGGDVWNDALKLWGSRLGGEGGPAEAAAAVGKKMAEQGPPAGRQFSRGFAKEATRLDAAQFGSAEHVGRLFAAQQRLIASREGKQAKGPDRGGLSPKAEDYLKQLVELQKKQVAKDPIMLEDADA